MDRLVEGIEIAVELEEAVELGHELDGSGAARAYRSEEAGAMRVAGELTIAGGFLASSRGQDPRAWWQTWRGQGEERGAGRSRRGGK